MALEGKDEELSMLLKTVIPVAAVSLLGLVLYALLPFWLFVVSIVIIAVCAAIPKTRNAIINALKPPPEPQDEQPAERTENKQ